MSKGRRYFGRILLFPAPDRCESAIEEALKSGCLIATEGCLPSALGTRIRISRKRVTVTDEPFTEAKEVNGGFAILLANSKEEAFEMAKGFLPTPDKRALR